MNRSLSDDMSRFPRRKTWCLAPCSGRREHSIDHLSLQLARGKMEWLKMKLKRLKVYLAQLGSENKTGYDSIPCLLSFETDGYDAEIGFQTEWIEAERNVVTLDDGVAYRLRAETA